MELNTADFTKSKQRKKQKTKWKNKKNHPAMNFGPIKEMPATDVKRIWDSFTARHKLKYEESYIILKELECECGLQMVEELIQNYWVEGPNPARLSFL